MTRNNEGSFFGTLGALVTGAFVGAIAIFFSDEKNRKRLKVTAEEWKQKADKAIDGVEKKVETEIEKTQANLNKNRKA